MENFNVKLCSISKPLIEEKELSPEEFITYAARVSNPSNQLNTETAPKLIKYLLDNKHFSPFEMVDFSVEIQTSRGIAPQILRHWSFSFQEFSQRYSKVNEYMVYPARRQDNKNRQNSVDDMDEEVKQWFIDAQHEVAALCFQRYQEAIEKGIAKEQARFLLPLSTKTTLYMKGNLRDWIFYLNLRRANGTQKEHADIANEIIKKVMIPNFPNICEAMGWL